MGNMREISVEECMRVSGGAAIVVSGRKSPSSSGMESFFWDSFFSDYLSGGGGGGGGGEVAHDPDGDDDGDGIRNMDEEIVVLAPSESQITAALNRFSAHQASLPVSYWGFSGAMGLGIGFKFIYDAQTGAWDVDVAGTAGLGFFVEAGAASNIRAANDASEATANGWWVIGKLGGSAGGEAGTGRGSVGGQFGAGGMITDSEIIP